jgi:hypothetical protein
MSVILVFAQVTTLSAGTEAEVLEHIREHEDGLEWVRVPAGWIVVFLPDTESVRADDALVPNGLRLHVLLSHIGCRPVSYRLIMRGVADFPCAL